MTERTAQFYGLSTVDKVAERVIPKLDIVATIPTVDGNTITVNTTTSLTVTTHKESLKVEVFINSEYIGDEYLVDDKITVVLEANDVLTYRAVEVV